MQGRLDLANTPEQNGLAAFDPQGLVFAVATGSKFIRLYDARNWDRGAFTTFQISNPESSSDSTGIWNNLQFSPDGKEILIGTSLGSTSGIVLDSFDGSLKGTLESPSGSGGCPLIYSPDSKFIIGGRSEDGQLDVWTVEKFGNPIVEAIEGISREPIRELAFNPKYAMLSTVNNEGTVFHL